MKKVILLWFFLTLGHVSAWAADERTKEEKDFDPVVLLYDGQPVHWSDVKRETGAPEHLPLHPRFIAGIKHYVNNRALYEYGKEHHLIAGSEAKKKLEDYERSLLIELAVEQLGKDTQVSEEVAKEYYILHKEQYIAPESVKAVMLMVADEAEAERVRQELLSIDPADAASKLKHLQASEKVIEIHRPQWLIAERLNEKHRKILFEELSPQSRVSRPVFELGAMVVWYLVEKQEKYTPSFAEVKDVIIKSLRQQKLKKAMDGMAKRLTADKVRYPKPIKDMLDAEF